MLSFFSRKSVSPSIGHPQPKAVASEHSAPKTDTTRFDPRASAAQTDTVTLPMTPPSEDIISTVILGMGSSDIQVAEADSQDLLLDQAAMMYATGDLSQAIACLEEGIRNEPGLSDESAWKALFELYDHAGMLTQRETLSVTFASVFGKVAPSVSRQKASPLAFKAVPKRPTEQSLMLPAQLHETSAPLLEGLLEAALKKNGVTIEAGHVTEVSRPGALALLRFFKKISENRVPFAVSHSEKLISLFQSDTAEGKPERRQAWLNFLDLLQYCADVDQFEMEALNFAVAFEESPPSWEGRRLPLKTVPVAAAVPEAPLSTVNDSFVFEGNLTALQTKLLDQLTQYAHDRNEVNIECSKLSRVDFSFASALMNTLSNLRATGKKIVFHQTNTMVATLFKVMGIDMLITYA